jgi:hypothetical protein
MIVIVTSVESVYITQNQKVVIAQDVGSNFLL